MSCRPDLVALACLLAVAAPAGARPADERVEIGSIPLEDLLDPEVTAASRAAEPGSEAPATVFVLAGEDLRAHGFRTLWEALRVVPGLFGYADGLYPSIGVRGVGLLTDYTTRLLVLVDGHPVNNSVGIGESYLGRDLPVPMDAVTRIEVIEGPVGGVYGPTAFLGVVNVVTRAPGTQHAEGLVLAEGVQGAVRGAEATLATSGRHAAVALSAYGTAGQDWTFPELSEATPGGVVRDADARDALAAYLRVDGGPVELRGACGLARRGIPSAPYSSVVGDPRNRLENRTCWIEGEGSVRPRADLTLTARVAYDDFAFEDRYAYPPPPRSYGVFRDPAWDRWVSGELRAELEGGRAWRLLAGATGEVHATSQATFAEAPDASVGPIRKRFGTLNGFAMAEGEPHPRVHLDGGLTWYAHSIFGSRVTPRVAALVRLGRADLVKAIYSQGFRAPTMAEAFYEDATDYLANPDLRPERATSLELAWERRLGGVAALGVSGFWTRYRDLIALETVPAPGVANPNPNQPDDWRQQERNAGALTTYGGSARVTVRARGGVSGWVGASAQAAGGERPRNFPAVILSGAISARTPWRPLRVSASGAWLAARRKDDASLVPGARTVVPGAGVLSLAAALEVPGARGLAVEAAFSSALGASRLVHPLSGDFYPVSELPEEAPTVRAGVRWSFE